jgi:hypothetical protein
VTAVELSDWYELVEGRVLEQGDILEGCPLVRIPEDLSLPLSEDGSDVDLQVEDEDMIVMSQSCDLAEDQKKGAAFVTLCPLWALSRVEEIDQFMASAYGKEMCRRGNMPGYHMLAACKDERWIREISIVAFREVHSLPIDFLRNYAESSGARRRIRSPYREHLAQSFARFFMRVGLPVDIDRFAVPQDEERAIKRLETLDDEARRRVIDAVGY